MMDLSLIIPVYNEEECIERTLQEAHGELGKLSLGFEILAVDDGSTDRTPALLKSLAGRMPVLRVLRLSANCGQSAAIGAGVRYARGRVIVLMDADGQNDPAEIPRLLEGLKTHGVCCGIRARRQDSASKRLGGRLANRVRNWVLGDDAVDSGCTLKAFQAEWLRDLPMFRGMHRFLPALVRMKGATVTQIPVNHRPRAAGRSKYSNWGRLKEAVWDLWAVRWMQKRTRRFQVEEVRP
jgi:dolichol-phosphate mannosyltransferase